MNDFDHIELNQLAIMHALAALVADLPPPAPGYPSLAASLLHRADATQAFLDFKLRPIPRTEGSHLSHVEHLRP